MKKSILEVFFLLNILTLSAQVPSSWTVNPSSYNNSMVITCVLNIDSKESIDQGDVVAAFIGSEVRGVASPITYLQSANRYVASLIVYSNLQNELITFKLYSKTKNAVSASVTLPVTFVADGAIGSYANPLVIKDNNIPTDLILSKSTIDENKPSGTLIGALTVTDADVNDTHALSLLDGAGFEDNAFFEIKNGSLYSKQAFDFETKSSHTIRVQAQDSKQGTIVKTFQIAVVDDNLPTVFAISNATINENQAVGTTVGALNVVKENVNNTFALSLVAGQGDDDNASFEIINGAIRSKAKFDYETKSSYTVRVQAQDPWQGTMVQVFQITVVDDKLPTVFSLLNTTINENQPAGTIVGVINAVKENVNNAFTLSLVPGPGGDDNALFEVFNGTIRSKAKFDYEAKSSYTIRVQAQDPWQGTMVQVFQIAVVDDNLPTVFAISNATINENQPVGTIVGAINAVKENVNNAFALSLVAGQGGDDNALFEVYNGTIRSKAKFDFEAKSSYTIRVQAQDPWQGTMEQAFQINVVDDNLPTVFTLSNARINENQVVGTKVGTLNVVKENVNNTFALSLVAGQGGDDNALFEVKDGALYSKTEFDFEAKASYTVRVQALDPWQGTIEKAFQITVIDDNLPTVFALSNVSIKENQPVATVVGLFNVVKENVDNTFALSLVTGQGGDDNALFEVKNGTLYSKSEFDFEAKSSYTVRVQAQDAKQGVMTKVFVISVIDDALPTSFTLSNAAIDENKPVNTTIGNFTVVKENRSTFDLSFAQGVGGEDNDSFVLSGTVLKSKSMYDFETKKTYNIRIKAENTKGEVLFSNFIITINDINDIPELITLDNNTIAENSVVGSLVAKLTTKDQDQDKVQYSFAGTDKDYQYFEIKGDQLLVKKNLDFEQQQKFELEIISNDGRGGQIKEKKSIIVLDVNEAPVIVKNSNSSELRFDVSELAAIDTVVGKIEAGDTDGNTTLTYTLISAEKLPFTINNEGVITLSDKINFETKSNYSFQVKVTDNGNPILFDEVPAVINVDDEIETVLSYNNLVTPNGDGHNDVLKIFNIDLYSQYSLSIYNIRGQVVYTSVNYQNDWNGRELPSGDYYLYFSGKDQDKNEFVYKEVFRLAKN